MNDEATPRTDAPCNVIVHRIPGCQIEIEVVPADFARGLERELNALRQVRDAERTEAADLLTAAKEARVIIEQLQAQLASAQQQLTELQKRDGQWRDKWKAAVDQMGNELARAHGLDKQCGEWKNNTQSALDDRKLALRELEELRFKVNEKLEAAQQDKERLRSIFHKCWGEAHDSPNYNKPSWMQFQQLIEKL